MIVHCRKYPTELRAAQWLAVNTDEVKQFCTLRGACWFKTPGDVDTDGWDGPRVYDDIQGEWLPVGFKDWIILEHGALRPVRHDLFRALYEITSYALVGTSLG